MQRSGKAWLILGLGALLVLVFFAGGLLFLGISHDGGGTGTPFGLTGRVGIADLEGVILSADKVRDTLDRFRKAPNVKAVVLRINSPGGGVAASQEINRPAATTRPWPRTVSSRTPARSPARSASSSSGSTTAT
jgi:protease-4